LHEVVGKFGLGHNLNFFGQILCGFSPQKIGELSFFAELFTILARP
jgi:hypothetical protein